MEKGKYWSFLRFMALWIDVWKKQTFYTCVHACICMCTQVIQLDSQVVRKSSAKGNLSKKHVFLFVSFCFQKTSKLPSIIHIALHDNSCLPKTQSGIIHNKHVFLLSGLNKNQIFWLYSSTDPREKGIMFSECMSSSLLGFPFTFKYSTFWECGLAQIHLSI